MRDQRTTVEIKQSLEKETNDFVGKTTTIEKKQLEMSPQSM